jgi:hypothetical protein
MAVTGATVSLSDRHVPLLKCIARAKKVIIAATAQAAQVACIPEDSAVLFRLEMAIVMTVTGDATTGSAAGAGAGKYKLVTEPGDTLCICM